MIIRTIYKGIKNNLGYLLYLTVFTFLIAELSIIYIKGLKPSDKKKQYSDSSNDHPLYSFTNADLDMEFKRTIIAMKEDLGEES